MDRPGVTGNPVHRSDMRAMPTTRNSGILGVTALANHWLLRASLIKYVRRKARPDAKMKPIQWVCRVGRLIPAGHVRRFDSGIEGGEITSFLDGR
jgi:hypothetical protein